MRHQPFTSGYSFYAGFVQGFLNSRVQERIKNRGSIGSPRIFRAEGLIRLSSPPDFSLRLLLPNTLDVSEIERASPLENIVVGLFDELRDGLLRYLLCLGVSLHDGEEIIQEVFLLLFKHLQQEKSRENLRGWVFRVSRNLALKLRRENQNSLLRMVEFDETLHPRADCGACPEENAYDRQRQKHLWAVVDALPEQDQNCLLLRAEGLRYREIAETLGISLGSVAASLARSFGKLSRADGGSL